MADQPSSDDPSAEIDRILVEYYRRLDAGEKIDREQLASEYPEHAETLAELLAVEAKFQEESTPVDPRDTPTLLSDCAPDTTEEERPVLRYFGEFELLEEIARGGMGVVYQARQTSLNRTVAIKMILAGQLAQDTEIQRFHIEAEAAAKLQHPHIVRVFEVGEQGGQHYFAMEYIEGQSLAELVREHPLPARNAVQYIMQIAEAIEYAHQEGVLHRDLKPSNVLIDGNGAVKVTDFGLAKQLESEQQLTGTDQVLGTPSYMPPEQAVGNQALMGPASDVYSLGAVLYHLLTGRPPFAAATPLETIHQVLNQEPVSPRLFETSLPKDLETICLKCLQKEPQKRYLRMQELAEDLQRFLENRPILARPISRPARLWRWCRRRPLVASLTLACLLSLVAGTAFSMYYALAANQNAWQASQNEDRANRNAENERIAKEEANTNLQKARSALSELTQMSFRLKNVPDAQDLRTEMLQIVLAHSKDIVSSSSGNPDLQSDLAVAYKNIGFVNGALGSKKESIDSFKTAIEIMENSLENSPENLDLMRQLAETLNLLGWTLYESGENDEAAERFRHAITLLTHAGKQVSREEDCLLLSSCYHNLSIGLLAIAGIEEAIDPAQKSWELSKQLIDSSPENYSYQTRFARANGFLGSLLGRQGRWDEALPYYDETYKIHLQLLKENPADMDVHRRIAVTYDLYTRASIQRGNLNEALEWAMRSIELGGKLTTAFPTVTRYRVELGDHYNTLASIYMKMQKPDEAISAMRQSVTEFRAAFNKGDNPQWLVNNLNQFGNLLLEAEQFTEAESVFREMLRVGEQTEVSPIKQFETTSKLTMTIIGQSLQPSESKVDSSDKLLKDCSILLEEEWLQFNETIEHVSDRERARIIELLEKLVDCYSGGELLHAAERWRNEVRKLESQESRKCCILNSDSSLSRESNHSGFQIMCRSEFDLLNIL